MATKQQHEILRRAERAMLASMTDEELEAIIAEGPPDPVFDAAIKLLSVDELEWFLNNHHRIRREQLFALVAGRTHAPDAQKGSTR